MKFHGCQPSMSSVLFLHKQDLVFVGVTPSANNPPRMLHSGRLTPKL
jgi:hypothetical protein